MFFHKEKTAAALSNAPHTEKRAAPLFHTTSMHFCRGQKIKKEKPHCLALLALQCGFYFGADSGNRTRITSLEGWSFTTKLYLQTVAPLCGTTIIIPYLYGNCQDAVTVTFSSFASTTNSCAVLWLTICAAISSSTCLRITRRRSRAPNLPPLAALQRAARPSSV